MLPPLILELRAKTGQFTRSMAEGRAEVAKTGSHFQAASSIGKAALLGIAGVAVVVGAASIKMAADFQESTTQLVTGAGESEANIKMVRDGILSMASQVGQVPIDLSKGMYLIESAGYHGAAGLAVLRAAAEGAKVGGADMRTVADGLTTAMTDYQVPTSKAALITSQLVATVAAGKTTMEALSGSLHNVLPIASALHVPFAQIAGAMATMTAQGISADAASTALRFALASLINPAGSAKKELKLIGLSADSVKKALSKGGLQGALALITDAVGKKFPVGSIQYTAALAKAVGGTRGMTAALALTGAHAKTFADNIKTIGHASTEAGGHVKGFALTQQDLNAKIANVRAGVSAMAIKLGDVLIPIVEKVTAVGVQWTNWLIAHKPVLLGVAIVIGTLLVAAIGAWIISMGMAAAATLAATWPLLAIVAGISLLVAGVIYAWNHFQTFRTIVLDVFHAIQTVVSSVVGFIRGHWVLLLGILTGPFGLAIVWVTQHWSTVLGVVNTVWGGIQRAWSTLVDVLTWPFRQAVRIITTLMQPVLDIISQVTHFLSHGSNTGPPASRSSQNGPGHPIRDSGGPTVAGMPYLIGLNRQPEIWTAPSVGSRSGMITPLGRGGGGTQLIVNIGTLVGGDRASARRLAEHVYDDLQTINLQKKRRSGFDPLSGLT
jgi:TP901 family phage tail tape measure protein